MTLWMKNVSFYNKNCVVLWKYCDWVTIVKWMMIRDTRISHHTPLWALIFQRMNYEWTLYLLLLAETYFMIMMVCACISCCHENTFAAREKAPHKKEKKQLKELQDKTALEKNGVWLVSGYKACSSTVTSTFKCILKILKLSDCDLLMIHYIWMFCVLCVNLQWLACTVKQQQQHAHNEADI